MKKIIEITNGVTRHPDYRMADPVNLTVCEGECVAIVGRNGAGKSMLVDIITGRHPLLGDEVHYDFTPATSKRASDNIAYLTFRDSYGTADANYYYQQRWNQHDIDHAPLVGDMLAETRRIADSALEKDHLLNDADRDAIRAQRAELAERLFDEFDVRKLFAKQVILLSSGELRKFQLTKALLTNPRVLILDNPFVGLDEGARKLLHDVLAELVASSHLCVILVLSKTNFMPTFVTHVVEVVQMAVRDKCTLAQWKERQQPVPDHMLDAARREALLRLPDNPPAFDTTQPVIAFHNVHIQYGDHTILHGLNLEVHNEEHWALSGENGAGKSTLLSIVCADNPQAYANDIVLFGHHRGHGESIWDIKRHIGYISPEMHRAYQRDVPTVHVVASGLSDAGGLYFRPRAEQMPTCEFWMDMFGIGALKDRSFLRLSSGQQRLALLARAFVRDPALLILDEPFHGLDNYARRLVSDIIETFCKRPGKTLIMVTHYPEELPPVIDHSIRLLRLR